MTAAEMNNWYYTGNGQALHDELGQIFGLKSFLAGNTGTQAGGWFTKEVRSPEDFQGLKFRMPGLGGAALGRLGASIQNIPGGEVYQALASGALDGTDWIGPWADEKAGFSEIAKFYYTAGFHEPAAGLSAAMNRDVWESLSPAHQRIVEISAGQANVWNLSQYQMNNGSALERLKAGGVTAYQFTDAIWDALGQATKDELADAAQDDLFARILEDYQGAMRALAGWSSISEEVFVGQRNRIFG